MCGITGFLEPAGARSVDLVSRLADVLHHRGPDASGAWEDADAGIWLGHRRLAIIDISESGAQPMASASGKLVITFNGEIYNYRELRSRLSGLGHEFHSESDTEVLLAAITEWGIEEAVRRSVGMFAFGLWDREKHTLTLVRDRMGEKPLYYGRVGDSFCFASELKAMRAHPGWNGAIDRDALTLFLRHGYVPGPFTIYSGIHKLPPGHTLTVSTGAIDNLPEPVPYWSLAESSGLTKKAFTTDEEAIDALEKHLGDAVEQQMVSDVPLGAFLSGGIDSSTVVSLMQARSDRPVRTFTIGVQDPEHDEADAARRIADHLGTDHTEQYVRPEDALAIVPRLASIYDEPFADSSQIPTILVSELARRHVTVSLSGDGGDELFAGYVRYASAPQAVSRLGRIPGPLRRTAGRVMLNPAARRTAEFLTSRGSGLVAERAARIGEILSARSPLVFNRALHSAWPTPSEVVIGGRDPDTLLTTLEHPWREEGFGDRMLYADAMTYLPDDLLVKVDRAAMSVSLETRVPILDHRIVEFAMRLPFDMKVRDGVGKWILRQVLYRHVPQALVDGPKKGFSIPIGAWLRGPLRSWADELLDEDRIDAEGFFRPALISARWNAHKRGLHDWSYALWPVLMFQAWLEKERTVESADGISANGVLGTSTPVAGRAL